MSDKRDPEPGWYPDPAAPTWSLRYWDGTDWTDDTTPAPAHVPARDNKQPPEIPARN